MDTDIGLNYHVFCGDSRRVRSRDNAGFDIMTQSDFPISQLSDVLEQLLETTSAQSARLDLIDFKLNLLLSILIALLGGLLLPISIRLWRDTFSPPSSPQPKPPGEAS